MIFRWWPLLVLAAAAAGYVGLLVASGGASTGTLAFEALIASFVLFVAVELLIAVPCELRNAAPRWAGRVRVIAGVVIVALGFTASATHPLAGSRGEFLGFSVVGTGFYLLAWGSVLAERGQSRRGEAR